MSVSSVLGSRIIGTGVFGAGVPGARVSGVPARWSSALRFATGRAARAKADESETESPQQEPPHEAPASPPRHGPRLWDEGWQPTSRSEAIEVLGVDPDAGKDTIKTTVTRLRRALHPDHAIDEEDLALRERRLKQINVAWDIVSGKRRAS